MKNEQDKPTEKDKKNYFEETSDNCFFEGKEYSPGSIICMAGGLFECGYGRWTSLNKSCPTEGQSD